MKMFFLWPWPSLVCGLQLTVPSGLRGVALRMCVISLAACGLMSAFRGGFPARMSRMARDIPRGAYHWGEGFHKERCCCRLIPFPFGFCKENLFRFFLLGKFDSFSIVALTLWVDFWRWLAHLTMHADFHCFCIAVPPLP
jgi:hypothetical protein